MWNRLIKLYNSIYDEKSKKIFENRFLYNMTGNPYYMLNVIELSYDGKYNIILLDISKKN